MPELPDIIVYLEALQERLSGQVLERVRLGSPFLLRTVAPPLTDAHGRAVVGVRRLGKRVVLALEGELFLVLHLMIAGRLHWAGAGTPVPRRRGLAAFEFGSGTLVLTEAGTRKRASLHVVLGEEPLAALDPGGLEVLDADLPAFQATLVRESHTLKRALTDPTLFSGIGNAYSDEILHRARLSPVKLTRSLAAAEAERLYHAARATLADWLEKLRADAGGEFPEHVTAFRDGMAVHGRAGKPCPVCAAPVQRIVYAEHETNYCPGCQTGGAILADRALSRLLKRDWPRTLAELEERRGGGGAALTPAAARRARRA
jgi:formamidopyrimidine-DNA glycosylase